MNLVLVAEEGAGLQALRVIAASGHRLLAVLTSQAQQGAGPRPIARAARELGCPLLPAERVRDPSFAVELRSWAVDVLLNVHSLFRICGPVLSAPRIGAFNLHPGPLPRYAGLNAVSWALYHGEPEHGVTLHWMVPQIDAGAIAYADSFPVDPAETALSLSSKCVRAGIPLIERLLRDAPRREVPVIAQDPTRRRYFDRSVPQAGWIQWSRPAREVVGFVRACDYLPFPSPWGQPRTSLGGRTFAILRAAPTGLPSRAPAGTIGEARADGVLVGTGDEWVLVSRVQCSDGPANAVEALRPGLRFDPPLPT